MTSFIAAGGSGRSTSVIPAVPAASSVTTIAFLRGLPWAGPFLPTADGRSRPPSAPRHGHRSLPHRRIFPDRLIRQPYSATSDVHEPNPNSKRASDGPRFSGSLLRAALAASSLGPRSELCSGKQSL